MASQKALIEHYQSQIHQLNKNLAQATASINEFAQTRLVELKRDTERPQTESQASLPHEPKVEKVLTEDARSNHKMGKSSNLKSIVGFWLV